MTPFRHRARRLSLSLLLLVVAAAIGAACQVLPTPAPGASWTGAMVTSIDGGIQVVTPTGRQVIAEPTGTLFTQGATWDGSSILATQNVVASQGAGSFTVGRIVRFTPGQAEPVVLLEHQRPGEVFTWPLAGGGRVAFGATWPVIENNRYVDQGNEIQSLTTEGTGLATLVGSAVEPGISRDGSRLAYVAVDPRTYATTLKVRDLASGQETVLVEESSGLLNYRAPRISPDGSTVVFSAEGSLRVGALPPPGPAFAARLAGVLSPLVPAPAWAHGPPEDLYLVPVGGGPVRQLTSLLLDEPVPAWSPDGRQIAVIDTASLRMIDPATGEASLVDRTGGYSSLDWRP